ncbi:MAG: hypothetical protein GY842_12900 [bacterium]|nr:hypothetical protein [bacterium]
MSKRKKHLYAAAISLIGVVFLVDLATDSGGSGPKIAVASSRGGAPRVVQVTVPEDSGGRASEVIPTRFPEGCSENPPVTRDVFAPSAATREVLTGEAKESSSSAGGGEEATESGSDPAETPAERFSRVHVVSAVVSSGALTAALVDESWVRVGQQVEGWTLTGIRGHAVIFTRGEVRVELSVSGSRVSNPG